jgi:peptidoglycan/LPS O-acetylase OafA/YrhL
MSTVDDMAPATVGAAAEPVRAAALDGPRPPALAYQPALDGLRAIAVGAVLLYHEYAASGAKGGFLGVDLFFVLSGYLITSILLVEHRSSGAVSFPRFWARRARRLLPALGIFLLVVATYSAWIASPFQLGRLRDSSIASLFYIQNYWNGGTTFEPLPTGHTWSLAIEEQFYIVWPIALVALLWFTRGRPRALLAGIVALTAASAVLMAATYNGPNFGSPYARTEMRDHELLIGAALAVVFTYWKLPLGPRGRRVLDAAGIAALVMFGVLVYTTPLTSDWLYRGGFMLIALAAALIIAAATRTDGGVARFLRWKPLVWVGLLSYGLYLYHLPVYFIVARPRVPLDGNARFAARLAVTFALAALSFYFVERPIRDARLSRRGWIVLATSGAAIVLAAILWSTSTAITPNPANVEGYAYEQLAADAPKEATKVLVTGGALAASMLQNRASYSGNDVYGVARSWCSLDAPSVVMAGREVRNAQCHVTRPAFRASVDAFDPDVSLVMLGGTELLDRSADGTRLRVGTPEAAAFFRGQLDAAHKLLTPDGAPMFLATAPCVRLPALATKGEADTARRIDWLNEQARAYAREHADTVRIAEFGRFLCPDGRHSGVVDGVPYATGDGVTLTPAGADAAWRWLAPQLVSAGETA